MNADGQAERAFVMARDRECVLKKRDPDHVCRQLGMPHRSDNTRMLTVEHVKDKPKIGDPIIKRLNKRRYRAPDDRRHMVAMCHDGNVAVPSSVVREWLRDYLERVNR